jgi:hypothetical protein
VTRKTSGKLSSAALTIAACRPAGPKFRPTAASPNRKRLCMLKRKWGVTSLVLAVAAKNIRTVTVKANKYCLSRCIFEKFTCVMVFITYVIFSITYVTGFITYVTGFISYVTGFITYVTDFITYVTGFITYVTGFITYVTDFITYVTGFITYVTDFITYVKSCLS